MRVNGTDDHGIWYIVPMWKSSLSYIFLVVIFNEYFKNLELFSNLLTHSMECKKKFGVCTCLSPCLGDFFDHPSASSYTEYLRIDWFKDNIIE